VAFQLQPAMPKELCCIIAWPSLLVYRPPGITALPISHFTSVPVFTIATATKPFTALATATPLRARGFIHADQIVQASTSGVKGCYQRPRSWPTNSCKVAMLAVILLNKLGHLALRELRYGG
jgi:hypothetical protein